ncbi:MAG: hypothetical protein KGM98_05655, partial [Bacteroidota bacterium]|nr:hypothetical protein [Bacteroidota bacterium]
MMKSFLPIRRFLVIALILLLGMHHEAFAQTGAAPVHGLGETFLQGLKWGFFAVIQPCLYAMFPVTVTFFLK